MKVLQHVSTYQRLRRESAWKLLAADHAPVILGILAVQLLDKEPFPTS